MFYMHCSSFPADEFYIAVIIYQFMRLIGLFFFNAMEFVLVECGEKSTDLIFLIFFRVYGM